MRPDDIWVQFDTRLRNQIKREIGKIIWAPLKNSAVSHCHLLVTGISKVATVSLKVNRRPTLGPPAGRNPRLLPCPEIVPGLRDEFPPAAALRPTGPLYTFVAGVVSIRKI